MVCQRFVDLQVVVRGLLLVVCSRVNVLLTRRFSLTSSVGAYGYSGGAPGGGGGAGPGGGPGSSPAPLPHPPPQPPPPHHPHLPPADLSPNNPMAAAIPHVNNISPGAMPYARPPLVRLHPARFLVEVLESSGISLCV